ncbi:MAG TPA: hypothetical protein VF401_02185 [Candidatus Saccharimonadales bacterium]
MSLNFEGSADPTEELTAIYMDGEHYPEITPPARSYACTELLRQRPYHSKDTELRAIYEDGEHYPIHTDPIDVLNGFRSFLPRAVVASEDHPAKGALSRDPATGKSVIVPLIRLPRKN